MTESCAESVIEIIFYLEFWNHQADYSFTISDFKCETGSKNEAYKPSLPFSFTWQLRDSTNNIVFQQPIAGKYQANAEDGRISYIGLDYKQIEAINKIFDDYYPISDL